MVRRRFLAAHLSPAAGVLGVASSFLCGRRAAAAAVSLSFSGNDCFVKFRNLEQKEKATEETAQKLGRPTARLIDGRAFRM